MRGNVRLTKGFFENTLPGFVAQHPRRKIALLHIDCDLYSSTVTILKNVAPMLVPGTIIIFDELINYHGWEEGEFKAFMEFAAERKLAFEYVAYNRTGGQVAVRILDEPANHAVAIAVESGAGCRRPGGAYLTAMQTAEDQSPDARARRHHGAGHARCGLGAAKKKSRARSAVPRRIRVPGQLVPVERRHAGHHAGLPPARA